MLLWALGLVDEIAFPTSPVDVSAIDQIVRRPGPAALMRCTSLRPTGEILDHLDLMYRCHWITTEAVAQGTSAPPELAPGVVMERHHALNWLTCHEHAAWDDVRTDT